MINWIKILNKIDYKFNSLGCLSSESMNDSIYGELNFTWYGNKHRIDIHFSDTCVNCICSESKTNCICSFLSFKETKNTEFNTKTFSKTEVKKLLKILRMKNTHNIKVGETKVFQHLGELNDFAENNEYKDGEFEFLNTNPLTIKKIC